MHDKPFPPRDEHARRLELRRTAAGRLGRRDLALSRARLATAVSAAILAWLSWGRELLSAGWLLLPVAVFAVLVVVHERTVRRKDRLERAARFHDEALARLDDRWAGRGNPGTGHAPARHLYAADLDLFGPGSVFERICSARTRTGEATLARWLLEPVDPPEIRARQAAVEELRGRIDLREDLAVLAEERAAGDEPEALVAWGEEPLRLASPVLRAAATALPLASLGALVAWAFGGAGPSPFLLALVAQGSFALHLRPRVLWVNHQAERAGVGLERLAAVLGRVERERFEAPRLARIEERLRSGGGPPSRRIARLGRWVELLDARRNTLFAPFAALLLWGTHCAFALEGWRKRSGPHLRDWVGALGEVEALLSLAAYAHENPADPFPELLDDGETACFEAEGIGHPLLPDEVCVRNDLALGGATRVLVVSGSNMSGKSTLLRAVGVNAVLARAGAPVRAWRLRLGPVALGASIRVQDSLQEGISRFYAEILRLRAILDLAAGGEPVLFLVDEMLQGTNSHDRAIAAEAVVRGFVGAGMLGLLTTHDLALTRIAAALSPEVRNVHFEDHLEQGRMRFDYQLRDGVVTKSNALELMRAVGLDV
jgi:hypothetical protein